MRVELTYIPAEYWNEPISGFELISKGKELPKNSSFFLLWNPLNQSEEQFIKNVKHLGII